MAEKKVSEAVSKLESDRFMDYIVYRATVAWHEYNNTRLKQYILLYIFTLVT